MDSNLQINCFVVRFTIIRIWPGSSCNPRSLQWLGAEPSWQLERQADTWAAGSTGI